MWASVLLKILTTVLARCLFPCLQKLKAYQRPLSGDRVIKSNCLEYLWATSNVLLVQRWITKNWSTCYFFNSPITMVISFIFSWTIFGSPFLPWKLHTRISLSLIPPYQASSYQGLWLQSHHDIFRLMCCVTFLTDVCWIYHLGDKIMCLVTSIIQQLAKEEKGYVSAVLWQIEKNVLVQPGSWTSSIKNAESASELVGINKFSCTVVMI